MLFFGTNSSIFLVVSKSTCRIPLTGTRGVQKTATHNMVGKAPQDLAESRRRIPLAVKERAPLLVDGAQLGRRGRRLLRRRRPHGARALLVRRAEGRAVRKSDGRLLLGRTGHGRPHGAQGRRYGDVHAPHARRRRARRAGGARGAARQRGHGGSGVAASLQVLQDCVTALVEPASQPGAARAGGAGRRLTHLRA